MPEDKLTHKEKVWKRLSEPALPRQLHHAEAVHFTPSELREQMEKIKAAMEEALVKANR